MIRLLKYLRTFFKMCISSKDSEIIYKQLMKIQIGHFLKKVFKMINKLNNPSKSVFTREIPSQDKTRLGMK